MKALKNIDAAFIPMNLPYTMTPQEAAIGVRAFKPKIVYPYHFRFSFNVPNTNTQQFAYALRDTKTQVRVLDWYNSAPVARFMKAMKKGWKRFCDETDFAQPRRSFTALRLCFCGIIVKRRESESSTRLLRNEDLCGFRARFLGSTSCGARSSFAC